MSAKVVLTALLTLGSIVLAPFVTTAVTYAQNADPYQGIPAGMGFPADEAKLEKIRKDQDVSAMRRHGWLLWNAINQPAASGGPVWETWYSIQDAFETLPQPEGARNIQRNFVNPRQFESLGPQPEALGQALLSFVLFNKENFDHIRKKGYYLRSTLDGLNAENRPIPDRKS